MGDLPKVGAVTIDKTSPTSAKHKPIISMAVNSAACRAKMGLVDGTRDGLALKSEQRCMLGKDGVELMGQGGEVGG